MRKQGSSVSMERDYQFGLARRHLYADYRVLISSACTTWQLCEVYITLR